MNCEFSLKHYVECIELAEQEGYHIKRIKDYSDNKEDKKVILLRHDIDFSLRYAFELAELEHQIGVQSTYYVYLHSWGYNALAPESMQTIQHIQNMGHEIGLHAEGTNWLSNEENVLYDIIGNPIKSWTFHLEGLRTELKREHLIEPYRDIKMKYISDSGHNWREGCLCENIGKHNKMHVLMHPIWWVTNKDTVDDALSRLYLDMQSETTTNFKHVKNLLEDYKKTI